MTHPPPSHIPSSFKTDPKGEEEILRWCNHSPCFRASAHAAKRQSVCVCACGGGSLDKLNEFAAVPSSYATLQGVRPLQFSPTCRKSPCHMQTHNNCTFKGYFGVCVRAFCAHDCKCVNCHIQWFAALEQVAPFNSAGLHLSLWPLMVAYPHTQTYHSNCEGLLVK